MYTDDVRNKNFTAVTVNSQKQLQHVLEYTQPYTASRQYSDDTGNKEFKAVHWGHEVSAKRWGRVVL